MSETKDIIFECLDDNIDTIMSDAMYCSETYGDDPDIELWNDYKDVLKKIAEIIKTELEKSYTLTPHIPYGDSAFVTDGNGKILYPVCTDSRLEAFEAMREMSAELGINVDFLDKESLQDYLNDGWEIEV
jgi:hypothetical protein